MHYCLLVTSKKPINLLNNCISSLIKCGVHKSAINLYTDELFFYKEHLPSITILDLDIFPITAVCSSQSDYCDYGVDNFNLFTSLKFLVLLDLIKKIDGDDVVFIDCDIAFKFNPTQIFEKILKDYTLFFQLESYSLYPPSPGTGIIGLKNCADAITFLRKGFILQLYDMAIDGNMYDQDIITFMLYQSRELLKKTFFLPQVQFPVGKISHAYERTETHDINKDLKAPVPICFHANHVTGIQNKIKLLKAAGFYNI